MARRLGPLLLLAAVALIACSLDSGADARGANDLFRQGRYEDAWSRYEAILARSPAPEIAYNAGTALAALRRDQPALPRLELALESPRTEVQAAAQYNRGYVLFRLGDCLRARDAFAAALQLAPNDEDARFNLDVVQREMARGPGAPGSVCLTEQAQAGDSAPGDSSDGDDDATGSEPSQTQNLPDNLSEQMRQLLNQLQQPRPGGDRTTQLDSDHPNMSRDEALRLLEEARRRQGGFESMLYEQSTLR